MTDPHFTSIAQYRDVESINAYHQLLSEGHAEADVLAILGQKSRDNSRTPMQWVMMLMLDLQLVSLGLIFRKIIIRSTLDKHFRIKSLFSIRIKINTIKTYA